MKAVPWLHWSHLHVSTTPPRWRLVFCLADILPSLSCRLIGCLLTDSWMNAVRPEHSLCFSTFSKPYLNTACRLLQTPGDKFTDAQSSSFGVQVIRRAVLSCENCVFIWLHSFTLTLIFVHSFSGAPNETANLCFNHQTCLFCSSVFVLVWTGSVQCESNTTRVWFCRHSNCEILWVCAEGEF